MTYIIADAGVNWRNLNEADRLIEGCAWAGVNAVKFQAYLPFKETTYKRSGFTLYPETNLFSHNLNNIRLDEDKIAYLYYRCKNHGVDFMCTPMYPSAVPMLQPYVNMWKVRFKDRENLEILKLIYSSGKKCLISTDKVGLHPNAYYLFCVPEYPPKSYPSPDSYLGFDGYSCHIPVVSHIAEVVRDQQSKFLEVHAMLDDYKNEAIDQKVSLTISDLSKLVRLIKGRKIDVTSHSPGTRTIYTGGLLDDPNFWV